MPAIINYLIGSFHILLQKLTTFVLLIVEHSTAHTKVILPEFIVKGITRNSDNLNRWWICEYDVDDVNDTPMIKRDNNNDTFKMCCFVIH